MINSDVHESSHQGKKSANEKSMDKNEISYSKVQNVSSRASHFQLLSIYKYTIDCINLFLC